MALYVVQARGRDRASLERAVLIRDGFSWPAFVFAQVWLLAHRLWIPLIVWIGLEIAFILLVLPHVSATVSASVALLAHLFIGLEGNTLRLAKAGRRASLLDVVEGRDRDAAETRFFRRQIPDSAPDPVPEARSLTPDALATREVRA